MACNKTVARIRHDATPRKAWGNAREAPEAARACCVAFAGRYSMTCKPSIDRAEQRIEPIEP
eukprot:14004872-Alexandrium_andersonii.AAC.1